MLPPLPSFSVIRQRPPGGSQLASLAQNSMHGSTPVFTQRVPGTQSFAALQASPSAAEPTLSQKRPEGFCAVGGATEHCSSGPQPHCGDTSLHGSSAQLGAPPSPPSPLLPAEFVWPAAPEAPPSSLPPSDEPPPSDAPPVDGGSDPSSELPEPPPWAHAAGQ